MERRREERAAGERDVEALLTNPVNLALLNGTGPVATAANTTGNANAPVSGAGAMSAQANQAMGAGPTGGHKLCCMNPEVGHMLMACTRMAVYAFSWPLSEARLAHTHWNSQPLGNYDQDLGVSTISPEIVEGILYTLKMYGYQGVLRD